MPELARGRVVIIKISGCNFSFFSFSGRVSRTPFAFISLAYVLINILNAVVYRLDFDRTGAFASSMLFGWNAVVLISYAIFFSFVIRRLHDIDSGAWYVLVYFIPVVNMCFWLYLLVRRGTNGANRYGPDPTDQA